MKLTIKEYTKTVHETYNRRIYKKYIIKSTIEEYIKEYI